MPPPAVKTLRDLIYWQYSKIIADSAGAGKKNYRFIMNRFKKLHKGEIFWNEIREYLKEREKRDECIFCGEKTSLTVDHLFPRALGGLEDEKNVIFICRSCNSAKGAKRPYEFYALKSGLEGAKYSVPRIAEGKYLKLLYEVFQKRGILDLTMAEISEQFCSKCDLKTLCIEEKTEGKISPLCLDGIAAYCLKT